MQGLGTEEAKQITDLKTRQRYAQLTTLLQRYYIGPAKIKGIGSSRKIMLRSYGIETAADVEQQRVEQISGFGPVIAGSLVARRKSIEQRFVFNANQPINPADIAAIKATISKKKADLEGKLRQSLAYLHKITNEIHAQRNSIKNVAVQIWSAQKQAEIDRIAVTSRFSPQQRLLGLGAVFVSGVIATNAIDPLLNIGKTGLSEVGPNPISASPGGPRQPPIKWLSPTIMNSWDPDRAGQAGPVTLGSHVDLC